MSPISRVVLALSFLVLINLCNASISARKDWFRSSQAPAEVIKDYETHIPVVISAAPLQEYPQELVVQLSHFKLHLEMNSGLVHPRFSSRHYDDEGHEVIEKGHVNCFYHGSVEGHGEWQAVVSTCRGLRGSFGRLSGQELYHIEPLDHTNPELEQPHALYLDSQYSRWNGTCGTTGGIHRLSISQQNGMRLDKHELRRRQVNGFYIVEWAMLNDDAQFTDFGRNLSAVVLRDLEIANFVDSTYRPLSIRVVVVDVITWTRGNRFGYPADNDPNPILESLTEYVTQVTSERDSLMLITGVNLLGSTVGLAYVGTMCNTRFSVGLTQDNRAPASRVATTASHELGHILNMMHDDGRQCTCPDSVCIMAGVSSSSNPPTQWSSCSRSDLSTGFTSRNLNRCLGNEPQLTVGDPSCGNGIRENNEVCDCGTVEECTDPCCNATSCTLISGAQCSEGPCCDSCKFLSLGTVCRAATQECDITEFCSGESSDCPRDVYKQDGSICNQTTNYCFTGVCQSLDSQCQRYFQSENGVPECYSELNIQGTQSGNCGVRDGQYVACEAEHVQCGQLMCNGGSFQRNELSGLIPRTNLESVTSNGISRTCASFTLSPNSDTISPGLVPDGTRCGNESICVSHSCVALSSLDYIQACPVGRNGQTCSGNGVCNNLNQCSCNVGLTSADCGSGSGGSNTDSDTGSNTGVIVGAVLGTLFGIIVIAGVAAAAVITVLVIKKRRSKKSVPLTARSKPAGPKPSNLSGSQENLLHDSGRESKVTVSVVRPSRGYQPPPMHGSPSPERPPTRQLNANKPPKPSAPPSRVAPVVSRYPPSSSSSGYQPKQNGTGNSYVQATSNPKPPPPSRVVPPKPPPAYTNKGAQSSVAPKPGLPAPSRAGPPPPPSRTAPSLPSSRTVASSPSNLRGSPSSPDTSRAPAKPPSYASKPSKLQKQWPPPSAGDSPSSKPVSYVKKPLAPPRR